MQQRGGLAKRTNGQEAALRVVNEDVHDWFASPDPKPMVSRKERAPSFGGLLTRFSRFGTATHYRKGKRLFHPRVSGPALGEWSRAR